MTPPMGAPPELHVVPEPHDSADTLRDRQIGVLIAHARHVAEQIAEVVIMMRDLRRELHAHVKAESVWQKTVTDELRANSTDTTEIKALVERRRWWAGFRERLRGLRGWIVGIASTIAAVVGAGVAVAEWLGRKGPPGGGIGPGP